MREVTLVGNNFTKFAHLIPEYFQNELRAENVVGVGCTDNDMDSAPIAVILCREVHNWMEIVWMAVAPEYQGEDYISWELKNRMQDVLGAGSVAGIFADIPDGPQHDVVKHIFLKHGFEMCEVERPLYSLTVGDLDTIAHLKGKVNENGMTSLEQADERLKKKTIDAIREFDRPVPVAEPINWAQYDQKLSTIMVKDGAVTGLVLVTGSGQDGDDEAKEDRTNTALEFSLLWATEPMMIPYLISKIAKQTVAAYAPETEILIPTITGLTAKMVEKMAPMAKRQTVTQARYYFMPSMSET